MDITPRISPQDYIALKAGRGLRKKHKYRARETKVGDLTFPSALEAAVYEILKIRVAAGELFDLKLQTAVRLKEKCEHCGDGPLTYKVDFSATQKDGTTLYIEAKGHWGDSFKKRVRLWKKSGPGNLEIWGGSWESPNLIDTLIPQRTYATR